MTTTTRKKLEIFLKSIKSAAHYYCIVKLILICRRNFGDMEVEIFFEKFEWDYKREVYNSNHDHEVDNEEDDFNPDNDEKIKVWLLKRIVVK